MNDNPYDFEHFEELIKRKEDFIRNQKKSIHKTEKLKNKYFEKYIKLTDKNMDLLNEYIWILIRENKYENIDIAAKNLGYELKRLIEKNNIFNPYMYSNGTDIFYINGSTICKACPKFILQQHLYYECDEAHAIYKIICELVQHVCIFYKKYFFNNSSYLIENPKHPYYQALLQFYANMKHKIDYPHPIDSILRLDNYYVLNGNLIENTPGYNNFILTKQLIDEYFIKYSFFTPKNKTYIKNIFKEIKSISKTPKTSIAQIQNDKCFIFAFDNNTYLNYSYNQNNKKMISSIIKPTSNYKTVNLQYTIQPKLTTSLSQFLNKLTQNDLNTLRTLAIIAASLYLNNQSAKKLFITESKNCGLKNLLKLLNMIDCKLAEYYMPLDKLLTQKTSLNVLANAYNEIAIPHIILTTITESIKKIDYNEKTLLKSLISGATIKFKDPYLDRITLNNNTTIVSAGTISACQFLKKNFTTIEFKIYDEELNDFEPSDEEIAWLREIFLPWGMDLICNKTLDVTKNLKAKKQPICNSIEEFINYYTDEKTGSHIYRETLYDAYLAFYSKKAPNEKPISIGAFTKYVKNMDNITYSRYNIRKSSKCDTPSNRYAFKNLMIKEDVLSLFLSENLIASIDNSEDFNIALKQITNQYSNLFKATKENVTNKQLIKVTYRKY